LGAIFHEYNFGVIPGKSCTQVNLILQFCHCLNLQNPDPWTLFHLKERTNGKFDIYAKEVLADLQAEESSESQGEC